MKSLPSPVVPNPDLPAGTGSSMLSSWRDKGIHVLGDLFKRYLIFQNNLFHIISGYHPGVFLLGLPSRESRLPASYYKRLEKLFLIAQKCILHNWIKDSPLSVTLWFREIFNTRRFKPFSERTTPLLTPNT